jgi:hypothetical protein
LKYVIISYVFKEVGGSFLEVLTLALALIASYASAATLDPACPGKMNAAVSGHIILASYSDLNSLNSKVDDGEFYDPSSDVTLRSVPLTKIVNGKISTDLYIFDPKSHRSGIIVETDGKIKAVEISAYPEANKNLGLAISDKNLFLFNPADGKMIKILSLQEIHEAKFPIIFHDEENPRDVFIVEKDHIQVISREAAIIYHDLYLSHSFRPKHEGVLNKTLETSTGGIVDITLDDTQLILRNSHGGDILKAVFLKDIIFPYDSNLLVEPGLVLGLYLAPNGEVTLFDRKSKAVILKFQKGSIPTL